MYNHLDQAMVGPVTFVYRDLAGVTYNELWIRGEFENSKNIELSNPQDVFAGNVDKNGRSVSTVVRKLEDGRYLVCIMVTHMQTGFFSDKNYRIFSEHEMYPLESA